jgi:hypothetical protein
MTDNGLSALAAALKGWEWPTDDGPTLLIPGDAESLAGTLLARGAVFLPDGLVEPVFAGEGADRVLVLRNSLTYHAEDPRDATIAALRAALDGLVAAASTFLANYDAVAESDDPMAAGAHEEGWWITGAAALDDALDEAGR